MIVYSDTQSYDLLKVLWTQEIFDFCIDYFRIDVCSNKKFCSQCLKRKSLEQFLPIFFLRWNRLKTPDVSFSSNVVHCPFCSKPFHIVEEYEKHIDECGEKERLQ